MKRKQKLVGIVLVIAALIGAIAWAPNFPGAPYKGDLIVWERFGYVYARSKYISWTSWGRWLMHHTDVDPVLDTTADCTDSSPQGDKLNAYYVATTLPNWWVQIKNDCGNSSIREEVDVHIWSYFVEPWVDYICTVHYKAEQHSVAGEINVTYQRLAPSPRWDWLEKENYWVPASSRQPWKEQFFKCKTCHQESKIVLRRRSSDELYSYIVERAPDGALHANVIVDFVNPTTRANYIAMNRIKARSLIEEGMRRIPVTVTFIRPLSIEEFKVLVQNSKIHVNTYGFDAMHQDGNRATIAVVPHNGKLVDEKELS